jgi:carboxypeptidase PM20D1
MIRLALAALAVIVLVLAGFVGYRTMSFSTAAPAATIAAPDVAAYDVDVSAAALRLSEAIRFRTVSLTGEASDQPEQFDLFHAWMQARYPAFHAAATREVIGGRSLLYTWEGSDPAQPPLLLLAHQDVVPVPDDTRAAWSVDPFAGIIRDNAIWGRGAIDDKSSLIGLLEAAEMLAAAGRKPTRTILFAFGHDEELGGSGASAIAAHLDAQGVRAWFALDEGLVMIAEHPLTGGPASLIGVSEKGAGTLRVVARGRPGHSSMPPPETAVSLLAEAVSAIHAMPIDRSLEGGPALDMMRALGNELPMTTRMAVSNEWLFAPLLRQRLGESPAAMALLGTTVAPTMIEGGVRANVLPGEAAAFINLRIHPRDTPDALLALAREAVADLDGVTVVWSEPPIAASPVSRVDSSSYALVASMARAIEPEIPVAPALVLAGTDSRLYVDVAENVYRFQPILLNDEDLEGLHGVNEHLSVDNLERMIRFYRGLIEAGAMQ